MECRRAIKSSDVKDKVGTLPASLPVTDISISIQTSKIILPPARNIFQISKYPRICSQYPSIQISRNVMFTPRSPFPFSRFNSFPPFESCLCPPFPSLPPVPFLFPLPFVKPRNALSCTAGSAECPHTLTLMPSIWTKVATYLLFQTWMGVGGDFRVSERLRGMFLDFKPCLAWHANQTF